MELPIIPLRSKHLFLNTPCRVSGGICRRSLPFQEGRGQVGAWNSLQLQEFPLLPLPPVGDLRCRAGAAAAPWGGGALGRGFSREGRERKIEQGCLWGCGIRVIPGLVNTEGLDIPAGLFLGMGQLLLSR